nr:MAG TPA: hypothetical protein [Caudoviricetes sp.]
MSGFIRFYKFKSQVLTSSLLGFLHQDFLGFIVN